MLTGIAGVAVWVLAVLTPVTLLWGMRRVLDVATTWSPRATGPSPAPRPLERLVADLDRLARMHHEVEASDQPARAARLRSIELAYDDTLRACCDAVGIDHCPTATPLSAMERLQTEASLARAGLVW